ncbi:hypothetical protein [Oceaniglobus indicus]|uniref:hypothetical protein n=1 Tax=Oceaniglobus indicus TaxID=2047749 RepID=UPI00187F9C6F
MTLISDILMIAGALGAAFYCVVLSRRLTRFTNLENGMGGAIAVLSAQVDGMTRTLKAAQTEAGASGRTLEELTRRAEDVARRLELNVAALHDLSDADPVGPSSAEPAKEPPVSFRRPAEGPAAPPTRASPEPEPVPLTTASPPVRSFFSSHRHAATPEAAE